MHAHKQVYMSSGHKREQGKPPFLQCIDAYTGVSEANTVSGASGRTKREYTSSSWPSQVAAGTGMGSYMGQRSTRLHHVFLFFADTDTWWWLLALFRRRNDYEAAGTSGVSVRDSVWQRR